jgi:hypothetical protein
MKINVLSLSSLFFILANGLGHILNYTSSIMISWKVLPIEYGEILSIFSLISFLAIPGTLFYTLSSTTITQGKEYEIPRIAYLFHISTIIFTFILGIFCLPIVHFLNSTIMHIIIAIIIVISSLYISFFRGFLQGKWLFSELSVSLIGESSSKCILLWILLIWTFPSVSTLLFAVLISNILTLLYTFFTYKKHFFDLPQTTKTPHSFSLTYLFWLFMSLSCIIFLSQGDILFVRSLSPNISWEYWALSRLGQLVFLSAMIVIQLASPHIKSSIPWAEFKKIWIYTCWAILFWTTLWCFVCIFFSYSIVHHLFWDQYIALSNFLLPYIGAYGLLSLSTVCIYFWLYREIYTYLPLTLIPVIFYVTKVAFISQDLGQYVSLFIQTQILFFFLCGSVFFYTLIYPYLTLRSRK